MADRKTPHLGEVIKALRESRGLTQAQLADAAGISSEPIRRAERTARTGKPAFGLQLGTLIRIMGGLQNVTPLTDAEFTDLFDAANVSTASRTGLQRTVMSSSPQAQAARTLAMQPQPPSTAAQRVADLFDRLNAQMGTQRLLGILEGIAAANGIPVGDVDVDPPNDERPPDKPGKASVAAKKAVGGRDDLARVPLDEKHTELVDRQPRPKNS